MKLKKNLQVLCCLDLSCRAVFSEYFTALCIKEYEIILKVSTVLNERKHSIKPSLSFAFYCIILF